MPKHDQPNGLTHKSNGSKSNKKNREIRSASPSKLPPPTPESRPKASPRKRGRKEKKETKSTENAKSSSRALQDIVLEATPSIADSVADTDEVEDEATHAIAEAAAAAAVETSAEDIAEAATVVNGALAAEALEEPTTVVTVTSEEQDDGGIDTTRTKVSIEMPAGAVNEDFPENPEQAIQDAKAIIQEAKGLQKSDGVAASPKPTSKKRKAEELEVENSEEEVVTEIIEDEDRPTADGEASSSPAEKHVQFGERAQEPPAKRTRVMVPADEFRKQKMQKRALMGVTATVAVG